MSADHGFKNAEMVAICLELQAAWTAGDQSRIAQIETQVCRLTEPMARKFGRYFARVFNLPREDAEQECRMACIQAARKYDPARAAFASYASLWSKHRVARLKKAFAPLVPDFTSDKTGEDDSITEEVPAPVPVERPDLQPLLDMLTPPQRHIVERIHGLDGMPAITAKEYATYHGVDRSWVSHLYATAIEHLRSQFLLPIEV